MKVLITTDLHLTDSVKDEYRWDLFPWLLEVIEKQDISVLYVLGDITDSKDKHSSSLVNRIIDNFVNITKLCDVVVLKGNHDYLKADSPFLRFMDHIPNITFITIPQELNDLGRTLFLPHTRDPDTDWKDFVFSDYDYIFMHETARGSVVSNGTKLDEGIDPNFSGVAIRTEVYSGDIHVPQKLGQIVYVGSPYPVHFGDKFIGRCIILEKGKSGFKEVNFPTIQKFSAVVKSVGDLANLDIYSGDQVKLKIEIPPSQYSEWKELKQSILAKCNTMEVDLCGLELVPKKTKRVRLVEAKEIKSASNFEESLKSFASYEKLPEDIIDKGISLIGEV